MMSMLFYGAIVSMHVEELVSMANSARRACWARKGERRRILEKIPGARRVKGIKEGLKKVVKKMKSSQCVLVRADWKSTTDLTRQGWRKWFGDIGEMLPMLRSCISSGLKHHKCKL